MPSAALSGTQFAVKMVHFLGAEPKVPARSPTNQDQDQDQEFR